MVKASRFPSFGKAHEPMVTRVFYLITYHWSLKAPDGQVRAGYGDTIMWFPSPINHPIKVNAAKTTISRMMEARHVDQNGAAVIGLPDEFKYPRINFINLIRLMEDRVPQSKADEPAAVTEDMLKGMSSVDGRDVVEALAGPVDAAPATGPVAVPDVPADSDAPADSPTPAAPPDDSSPGVADDTGDNAATPHEDVDTPTRSEAPDGPEAGDPEPDPNRPFRGTVKFPEEGV